MPPSPASLDSLSSPSPSPPPADNGVDHAPPALDDASELSELTEEDQEDASGRRTQSRHVSSDEDGEDDAEGSGQRGPHPPRLRSRGRGGRKKRGGIVPPPMWDWAKPHADAPEEEEEEEAGGPPRPLEEEEDEEEDAAAATRRLPAANGHGPAKEDEDEEDDNQRLSLLPKQPPARARIKYPAKKAANLYRPENHYSSTDEDDAHASDDDWDALRGERYRSGRHRSRPLNPAFDAVYLSNGEYEASDGEISDGPPAAGADVPPPESEDGNDENRDEEERQRESVSDVEDDDVADEDDPPKDAAADGDIDPPAPSSALAAVAAVASTAAALMDMDVDTTTTTLPKSSGPVAASSIMAGSTVVEDPPSATSSATGTPASSRSASPARLEGPVLENASVNKQHVRRDSKAKQPNGVLDAAGYGLPSSTLHDEHNADNDNDDGADADVDGAAPPEDPDIPDVEVDPDQDADQDADQDQDADPDADAELELESDLQPAHRAEALDVLATIELKFALLREKVYVEKMDVLAWEESLVNDGTHPELLHLQAELSKRRDKRLELASRKREFELENVVRKRRAEEDAVWSWWKFSRDELQTDMISETNRKRRKLERDRRAFERPQPSRRIPEPPVDIPPPPSLRKIAKGSISNGRRNNHPTSDGSYPPVIYPELSTLSAVDINSDLEYIFAHRRPYEHPHHTHPHGPMHAHRSAGPPVPLPPPFDAYGNAPDAGFGGAPGPGRMGPPGAAFAGQPQVLHQHQHHAHVSGPPPVFNPMAAGPGSSRSQHHSSMPGLNVHNHGPSPFAMEQDAVLEPLGPGAGGSVGYHSQPPFYGPPGGMPGPSGLNYANQDHVGALRRSPSPSHGLGGMPGHPPRSKLIGPPPLTGETVMYGVHSHMKDPRGEWIPDRDKRPGAVEEGALEEEARMRARDREREAKRERDRDRDKEKDRMREVEREREREHRERERERDLEQREREHERDMRYHIPQGVPLPSQQQQQQQQQQHRHPQIQHPYTHVHGVPGVPGPVPHLHGPHHHHHLHHHHHVVHHHPQQQGNMGGQGPAPPGSSLSVPQSSHASGSMLSPRTVGSREFEPLRPQHAESAPLPAPKSSSMGSSASLSLWKVDRDAHMPPAEYRDVRSKHGSRPSSGAPIPPLPPDERDRPVPTPFAMSSSHLTSAFSGPSNGQPPSSPRGVWGRPSDGAHRPSGASPPSAFEHHPNPHSPSGPHHFSRPPPPPPSQSVQQSQQLQQQQQPASRSNSMGLSPRSRPGPPHSPPSTSSIFAAPLRSPTRGHPPGSAQPSPFHPHSSSSSRGSVTTSPVLKTHRSGSPKGGAPSVFSPLLAGPGRTSTPSVGPSLSVFGPLHAGQGQSPQSQLLQLPPGPGPVLGRAPPPPPSAGAAENHRHSPRAPVLPGPPHPPKNMSLVQMVDGP